MKFAVHIQAGLALEPGHSIITNVVSYGFETRGERSQLLKI